MIGSIQTSGDIINFHSHVHPVANEGIFKESGHFVHIPEPWKHQHGFSSILISIKVIIVRSSDISYNYFQLLLTFFSHHFL
jgi:hypothetical protein